VQSPGKVSPTAFWDAQSILLEFLEYKVTVNTDQRYTSLQNLKEVIQMKHPGQLRNITILFNYICPYTACHNAPPETALLEMYFSSTIQSEPCTLGLPSYQITEEPL
jgi:hypothetical protein